MYITMYRDESDPASPADPPQDHPGNVAVLLHAVGFLLGYGRHLLDTIRHRATAPRLTIIAACFGTSNLSTILAHLNRGLLRAAALERMLLARAAAGRDFEFVTRRIRAEETQPAPADPQPEPSADQPAAPKAARRPSLPPGWNDPEVLMPTQEDFDRQVRRRTIGSTIVDICQDLAVVPYLCTGQFWNELFDIMQCFGGSVVKLMQEASRREQAFAQQQDRIIDSNWQWLHRQRDVVHQVLGFFVGEPPVDPFGQSPPPCAPTEALATGPP